MFLSVVIPTRNRAVLLRRTLEFVARVEYPPSQYEVIVTDTASTDNTGVICQEFGPKLFLNFRYERCDRPGLHIGRNRGLSIARGEIVILADDDIRPSATWLQGMAESFLIPNIGLVGGNDLPDFESDPPAWVEAMWAQHPQGRILGAFSLVDFGDQIKDIPPQYVFGCNLGIRKELWRKAGGFHPDGMPNELIRYRGDGETAIANSIISMGCRSLFHPAASVFHWVPKSRMNYNYFAYRGFLQGISDSYTVIRKAGKRPAERALDSLRRIKRCLLQIKRSARAILDHGANAAYARHVYNKGHARGYFYHQREVHKDPYLFEWVLQQDYFDENASPSATGLQ
jgi:glucosyl-dolichyl phosphate glucuronosyltransferase